MGQMRKALGARFNFGVLSLVLLVFIALVYMVAVKYNKRVDFTQEKIFTLSVKSREILKTMGSEPIKALAFFKEGQAGRREIEDLFKMFHHENNLFEYELIDPDRNPAKAREYGVDTYGISVLARGKDRERFQNVSEDGLTNALLKLMSPSERVIYLLKGHGERDEKDVSEKGFAQVAARLESENYTIRELQLSYALIPDDATLILLAGPTTDLLDSEINQLQDFLSKGKSLLILLDPAEGEFPKLGNFLSRYGVEVKNDTVIDKLSRLFGADYLIPVITRYGKHAITDGFNVASFLPVARSVVQGSPDEDGVLVTELAFTSEGSWAERSMDQMQAGEVSYDEDDLAGPISLAVAVESSKTGARLVVVGDSDFASNAHLFLSGNKDFAMNIVAWLAGQEKLVTIRSKEREPTPLILSPRQQVVIFWIPVAGLPIATILVGMGVWFYRRKFA